MWLDTVDCKYVHLAVDTVRGQELMPWNNGDSGSAIKVKTKGTYIVTASVHKLCSTADTKEVDKLPMPVAQLSGDTSRCKDNIPMGTKSLATICGAQVR